MIKMILMAHFDERVLQVACANVRDDADLFGARLGGSRSGQYASDGLISAFLRTRQSKDCIVFLDEFDKIKDLHTALGHAQAKKIYQSFLEPWQEGNLTGYFLILYILM
jgi:hypothetical protein